MAAADPRLVTRIYHETRERVAALVAELDDEGLSSPLAACPGWSVRDVLAHMAAVADDWVSGRLTGPPTDEQTAAQVARFEQCATTDIISSWAEAAAQLDAMAETQGAEPPIGDVTCHEHDIRSAIDRPGARDSAAVWYTSDRLLASLRTPVPLRVTVEDAEYRVGPEGGAEIGLRTTRFEALRWRTGRRSRTQLAAMDWSGDPTALFGHLCMFGPTDTDIIE